MQGRAGLRRDWKLGGMRGVHMGLGGLSQRSHRSRPIIHYNPPPQHSWPDRGNAEAFYEFFAYVWQICIFCVYVWQICIFEAFITGIQALGWAPFKRSYFSSVHWFRETILNTALYNFEYCIVHCWVLFSAKRGVSFIIVAVLDVRQILDLVALGRA